MDSDKNKSHEQPKKCFCARCFLPIDTEDKVDIEGQSFHRMCSTCCVCQSIPTSLKMFYGHVFCNECFKMHVMNRFKDETPRMHSNSWWMQWAPGTKPQSEDTKKTEEEKGDETKGPQSSSKESPKRCICARCLQSVDHCDKIDIGGQSFHPQCARCYFCHAIPTNNVKIYYGQVFCEECFHRHILNRNKDNPSEFFRSCFEQWQNNPQFSEQMKDMMGSSKDNSPFIFMMQQGCQPPFCRCGTGPQAQEWFPNNEPKKSATPATMSIGGDSFATWELSFENRTEVSDLPESNESANPENLIVVAAAEKIEKLTKYLYENSDSEKCAKKWNNFIEYDKCSITSNMDTSSLCKWVDLQNPQIEKTKELVCPKCLWQCGPIFVYSDYLQKENCGDSASFE